MITLWELAQGAVFLVLLALAVRDAIRRHARPVHSPAPEEAEKPLSVLLPSPRAPVEDRETVGI